MTETAPLETRTFQAETKRLLDLVVHSLYTNKDVFLRELISNASDALDRLRFEAITQPELLPPGEELEIRIETDPERRTLTISDNGIGMSREETIENLGSIARSGTRELVEKLQAQQKSSAPPELIGNFGVGFYSAFMVADEVTVETRRADSDEAVHWESRAEGEYRVGAGSRSTRGTTIKLHLKPVDPEAGLIDFTDEWALGRIVKRYSDFISYPIRQRIRREKKEADAQGVVKPDGTTTIVTEDKTLNSQKPIWARAESEVSEDEYKEFYRNLTNDWGEPLLRLPLKAEGVAEYQALLFIPEHSPQNLYVYGADYGLALYAKRVLIVERCADLLPQFLRFLRGVVDSADLPLNVSRQMLQENRHVAQIRKWLTRKTLDALARLQNSEPEKYRKFWEEFGRAIKEGLATEFSFRDQITPLVLSESSADAEKPTTLAEYVSRMKPDQREIYYLVGESRALCEASPLLEAFRAKQYEVLFFTDPVDEFVVQYLPEFEGKRLRSIGRGDVQLGSDEEKKQAEQTLRETADRYRGMLDWLRGRLDDRVKQVRLSNRLTDSPACLAIDEEDLSPQMERLLRMSHGEGAPPQKRILELNPRHDVVERLRQRWEGDRDDAVAGDAAELLYGYALLAEGAPLPDPPKFNRALATLLARSV